MTFASTCDSLTVIDTKQIDRRLLDACLCSSSALCAGMFTEYCGELHALLYITGKNSLFLVELIQRKLAIYCTVQLQCAELILRDGTINYHAIYMEAARAV